jgi:DNA-binding response OmpR family regulator
MARTRSPKTSILLVDAHPWFSRWIQEALSDRGYRVYSAKTGFEAKKIGEEKHPDLVVMELMLPDTDGLVLCAELRRGLQIPIIVCSATQRVRDMTLANWLGADAVMHKPIELEDLFSKIESVLRAFADPASDGVNVTELTVRAWEQGKSKRVA